MTDQEKRALMKSIVDLVPPQEQKCLTTSPKVSAQSVLRIIRELPTTPADAGAPRKYTWDDIRYEDSSVRDRPRYEVRITSIEQLDGLMSMFRGHRKGSRVLGYRSVQIAFELYKGEITEAYVEQMPTEIMLTRNPYSNVCEAIEFDEVDIHS